MQTTCHIRKKRSPRDAALVLALAFFTLLAGCSAHQGRYGRVSASDEVSRMFQAYEVLPDHRYYFSGPEAQPFYIIGIDRHYTLQSEFWKPVDLTPRQIDQWLNFLGQRARYRVHPYGAHIVGPAGEAIGVWYSVIDWRSRGTVRLAENNQVHVSIPSRRVDHFEQGEGRDRFLPWVIVP